MPPPPRGRLHYPTALALPPDGDNASGATEQSEGVRIDRRAFRPLRKKKNISASEEASTADAFEQADGAGSVGTPSSPITTADWCSQKEREISALLEYDIGYMNDASYQGESSYLEGNRVPGDQSWYNEDSRYFESEGGNFQDRGLYQTEVFDNAAYSMRTPSPGGYPVAAERSNLGSPMKSIRSQSFGYLNRRSPIPKQDRVNRGAQMRQAWSRDRFLRNANCRKFDLRGCGSAGSLFQKPLTAPHIPRYVPPHQKRRDNLRMEVRQQMLEVAY